MNLLSIKNTLISLIVISYLLMVIFIYLGIIYFFKDESLNLENNYYNNILDVLIMIISIIGVAYGFINKQKEDALLKYSKSYIDQINEFININFIFYYIIIFSCINIFLIIYNDIFNIPINFIKFYFFLQIILIILIFILGINLMKIDSNKKILDLYTFRIKKDISKGNINEGNIVKILNNLFNSINISIEKNDFDMCKNLFIEISNVTKLYHTIIFKKTNYSYNEILLYNDTIFFLINTSIKFLIERKIFSNLLYENKILLIEFIEEMALIFSNSKLINHELASNSKLMQSYLYLFYEENINDKYFLHNYDIYIRKIISVELDNKMFYSAIHTYEYFINQLLRLFINNDSYFHGQYKIKIVDIYYDILNAILKHKILNKNDDLEKINEKLNDIYIKHILAYKNIKSHECIYIYKLINNYAIDYIIYNQIINYLSNFSDNRMPTIESVTYNTYSFIMKNQSIDIYTNIIDRYIITKYIYNRFIFNNYNIIFYGINIILSIINIIDFSIQNNIINNIIIQHGDNLFDNESKKLIKKISKNKGHFIKAKIIKIII